MKTEMARRMKDTNRFMWMKFLVQWSFLKWREAGEGTRARERAREGGQIYHFLSVDKLIITGACV